MLSNVSSSDPVHIKAMSVFETPNLDTHPYQLRFLITYFGEKEAGKTKGYVQGIFNDNTKYEFSGGVAFYDGNPPGHWTIGIASLSTKEFKKVIVEYAEAYFTRP